MLLTALRSAGRRLKLARIEGLVEETVPLYSTSDFKRCIRICRGTFEQFSTFSSLATWDDQSRMISPQNYPKRTHILPIPSKPYSVYSVHSAIGRRMNGIAFRSFRKRNRSQKNAIAVYSKYSYLIVPKECALRFSRVNEFANARALPLERGDTTHECRIFFSLSFFRPARAQLTNASLTAVPTNCRKLF